MKLGVPASLVLKRWYRIRPLQPTSTASAEPAAVAPQSVAKTQGGLPALLAAYQSPFARAAAARAELYAEAISYPPNGGREWQPKGQPEEVRIHDFLLPDLDKVSLYGVYDPVRNEGWVNVGTDHDTAAFAVASIHGWWEAMGRQAYPEATC